MSSLFEKTQQFVRSVQLRDQCPEDESKTLTSRVFTFAIVLNIKAHNEMPSNVMSVLLGITRELNRRAPQALSLRLSSTLPLVDQSRSQSQESHEILFILFIAYLK